MFASKYIAIVVLPLVKWSEFADVTKKIAKLRKSKSRPVDINNYNYLENAYFVMPFLSGTDGLVSLADFFFFFAFFPHCGAWSQATQMVSQTQTQLTMSLVPELFYLSSPSHPSRTHLSLSAHPLDALELWSSIYNDLIVRVIPLISVLDFFLRFGYSAWDF